MISREAWETGLALLAERFKELSTEMAMVYAERLVPALEDETFGAAVRYLIAERDPSFGYFPSVREILDTAGAGAADDCESAQRAKAGEVITWLWRNPESNGVTRYVSETTAHQKFGDIAVKALQSIGGGPRVLATSPEWFAQLRRDYVDAWLAYWHTARAGEIVTALVSGQRERSRLSRGMEPAASIAGRVTRQLGAGEFVSEDPAA